MDVVNRFPAHRGRILGVKQAAAPWAHVLVAAAPRIITY